MIERKDLEARIASLSVGCADLLRQIAEGEAAVGKLRGNLAMTKGALEECKHWLSALPPADEKPQGDASQSGG